MLISFVIILLLLAFILCSCFVFISIYLNQLCLNIVLWYWKLPDLVIFVFQSFSLVFPRVKIEVGQFIRKESLSFILIILTVLDRIIVYRLGPFLSFESFPYEFIFNYRFSYEDLQARIFSFTFDDIFTR
jgi:hypothetical protein